MKNVSNTQLKLRIYHAFSSGGSRGGRKRRSPPLKKEKEREFPNP